jgi:hypothetical protein
MHETDDDLNRGDCDDACHRQGRAAVNDLPPEVMSCVLEHAGSLRDRVAWAIAAPSLAPDTITEMAIKDAGVDLHGLLMAGAPLGVVEAFAARRLPPVGPSDLAAAARGGRVDVLEWVHQRLDPRRPKWFLHAPEKQGRRPVRVDGKGRAWYDDAIGGRCWANDDRQNLRWGPRHYLEEQYAGPVVDALCEAAHHGRLAALRWLLDNYPRHTMGGQRCASALHDCLACDAASGPCEEAALETLQFLHGLTTTTVGAPPDDDRCRCPREAGIAAAQAGNTRVLNWMIEARCSGAFRAYKGPVREPDLRPIAEGNVRATRWLIGAWDMASWRAPHTALNRVLAVAASCGHVEVIALVHGVGDHRCTLEALIAAAEAGMLDVLRWAAGETENPPRVPVRAWPSLAIGRAAARHGWSRAVRWMAARADAHLALDIGAARAALRHGMAYTALLIRDAGIAPFDQWDALDAAVFSRNLDCIGIALRGGARLTGSALRLALKAKDPEIVALVAPHYSADKRQKAVKALYGRRLPCAVLSWLAQHAPAVCIAGALVHPALAKDHKCRTDTNDQYRCPARCPCHACASGAD